MHACSAGDSSPSLECAVTFKLQWHSVRYCMHVRGRVPVCNADAAYMHACCTRGVLFPGPPTRTRPYSFPLTDRALMKVVRATW